MFEVDSKVQSLNNSTGTDPNAAPPHFIMLEGNVYKNFKISSHYIEDIDDSEFGAGKRLTLIGIDSKIESSLIVELYEQYPDVALSWCTYTNRTGKDLKINKVFYNYYRLDRKLTNPSALSYDFRYLQPINKNWGDTWTNIGIKDSTDEDFVIPGSGSNRSGIPFLDVWGAEMGMGIFHAEGIPRFHHIILKVQTDEIVDMGFVIIPEESYGQFPEILKNSQSISTWKSVDIEIL